MALGSWLRKLPTTVWCKSSGSGGFFLDEPNFRFEIARERTRVDRNGSSFAILMIDLPADQTTARNFVFLGRVLAKRLRITDMVGFLSGDRVAVLLPETGESGAWKVASDVCAVYPVGHDRPSCEVYVYPKDDQKWAKVSQEGSQLPVKNSSGSLPMDSFFAKQTPIWKRIIDVMGASLGLFASLPLLLCFALAIKLTSRGPAFYSQEREGLGGRRFHMYKLRTMRVGAEYHQTSLREHSEQDGPAFKMRNDPRATWIGRILRTTSLDELPQLWNVLRGDMSLVGPRPLPTAESEQCLPWQRQRLTVVPGMTCVWQVLGRNTVSFDEWMRMDLQYVRNRSLFYDMNLIVRTAPAIVFAKGPR